MDVFVYGTLTDPDRATSVVERFEYRGAALLDGLHRVRGTYPTLAPGGSVRGRLLRTADIASLDRYEGVERGLYVRISVPVVGETSATVADDGEECVAVYVGDPTALDTADPVSWPGAGSFRERVERYVREESVGVRCE